MPVGLLPWSLLELSAASYTIVVAIKKKGERMFYHKSQENTVFYSSLFTNRLYLGIFSSTIGAMSQSGMDGYKLPYFESLKRLNFH